MPVTLEWGNTEKTLLNVNFEGKWTWDDVYKSLDEIYGLLGSVDHKVNTVFDFTRSASIPMNALTHLRATNRTVHSNQALVILVGLNLFMTKLIDIFVRVYDGFARKSDVLVFSTHEEALAHLSTLNEENA